MVNIEWYGPPEGEKSVEHTVSYSIPVASGLMRHAAAMAQESRQILQLHRDTGDAKIHVVHRDGKVHGATADQWLDSVIELTATDERREGVTHTSEAKDDARAAASIEATIGPLRGAATKMVRKRRLSIK